MTTRGAGKNKADYGIKDVYKTYMKDRFHKMDISQVTYTKIIKEFNRELIKLIIYKNYEFRFPYNLGHLRIKKLDPVVKKGENGLPMICRAVNFNATNKLWARDPEAKAKKKRIYHLNEHSDGKLFKWYWDKGTCNIPNHRSYTLIMSRENKRWLSSLIQDPSYQLDYFE